jgi:hypothetical protein
MVDSMMKCWVIRARNGARGGQEFVYWNTTEGWVYDPMIASHYLDETSAGQSISDCVSAGLWLAENVAAVQIFTTT